MRSCVGVELTREDYEAGEWAGAVEDAYMRGREQKALRNRIGVQGNERRKREGRQMAEDATAWVNHWWQSQSHP